MPKDPDSRGQLIGPGIIGGTELVPPIPTLAELGLDKKTSKLAQDAVKRKKGPSYGAQKEVI